MAKRGSVRSMQDQSAGNGVTGSQDYGSGTDKLRSEDIPRGSGGTDDGTRGGALDSIQSKNTSKGQ